MKKSFYSHNRLTRKRMRINSKLINMQFNFKHIIFCLRLLWQRREEIGRNIFSYIVTFAISVSRNLYYISPSEKREN